MEITIKNYKFSPSPEEIAIEFCDLYQDGQVKFLNKMAEIFNKKGNCISMQLEYITQEKNLTMEARFIMSKFGNYAYLNMNNKEES